MPVLPLGREQGLGECGEVGVIRLSVAFVGGRVVLRSGPRRIWWDKFNVEYVDSSLGVRHNPLGTTSVALSADLVEGSNESERDFCDIQQHPASPGCTGGLRAATRRPQPFFCGSRPGGAWDLTSLAMSEKEKPTQSVQATASRGLFSKLEHPSSRRAASSVAFLGLKLFARFAHPLTSRIPFCFPRVFDNCFVEGCSSPFHPISLMRLLLRFTCTPIIRIYAFHVATFLQPRVVVWTRKRVADRQWLLLPGREDEECLKLGNPISSHVIQMPRIINLEAIFRDEKWPASCFCRMRKGSEAFNRAKVKVFNPEKTRNAMTDDGRATKKGGRKKRKKRSIAASKELVTLEQYREAEWTLRTKMCREAV
ncbi:hypothetical protein DFJ73DRAFT_962048 [Zopfochytrium polystomum]|nr:hypothetical protein DFJ73DRAFT_962048 [Zopfochytrium polystomum]